MRTNVVVNDDLMREAMQYSSRRTKRALIEEALRTYVEVKAAERTTAPWIQKMGDRIVAVR